MYVVRSFWVSWLGQFQANSQHVLPFNPLWKHLFPQSSGTLMKPFIVNEGQKE
jgi:hypothetical protein